MEKHKPNKKSTQCVFSDDRIAQFSTRLKELIGAESIRAFGEKIGVTDSGLRKYLPPYNSKPTFDKLVAISRYKGVNIEWLATGEGPKFSVSHHESKNEQLNCINSPSITLEEFNEEFILVPGYHVQVSAGNGCTAFDQAPKRHLAFRRKYFKYRRLNPDNLVVVFAKGDSMGDTIKDNDSLVVDLSDTQAIDGQIFVIRLGDELYAKRIQKSYNGSIILISDNKEYSPIEVPKEELDQLCIIGRVVQRSTDM
ncbi:S24 family peptidase [Photobacterium sp.]|uniref:S24 family peptidase n=1 Tax=Photobacterium sp. TaxID=660 RepID=UPI00299F2B2D|nr:S24 family peptidase [Photobacterium sp.]MDX1301224.1 S24 family peptidase [Photobacterium sp.]